MKKSSIAERYLRTLESNAMENAPKSPPKSLRSPTKQTTPAVSPTKTSSPNRSSPAKASQAKSSPVRTAGAAKVDASARPGERTSRDTNTTKQAEADGATASVNKSTPARASKLGTQTSPVKNAATAVSSPSSPVRSQVKSPIRSARKELEATTAAASSVIGPKPDRRPLMHNQDLSPSEIAWDRERENWQAYEYLCHVSEAKAWIEKVIGEEQPPASEFPSSLQNGIALAKLTKTLHPELMKWPIFEHRRLQYRHTENITLFFDLLEQLRVPSLFQFDMTDLYEKRNLPKVIYCIHAVSHYIADNDNKVTAVDDLVGKLEFSDDQLTTTQKGLAGQSMPNFGAMTRKLSGKHPKLDIPDDSDENDDGEKPLHDQPEQKQTAAMGVSDRDRDEPDASDYDADDSLLPPPRIQELDMSDSSGAGAFSTGESEDDTIEVIPPRRYRRSRPEPRRYRRREPSENDDSFRDLYHDTYHGRYRDDSWNESWADSRAPYRFDARSYRGYGYRNLSSTGSLRSRVLSSAESMLARLEELEPTTILLQARARGALLRSQLARQKKDETTHKFATQIQALARGYIARRGICRSKYKPTPEQLTVVVAVQAVARGIIVRRQFRSTTRGADHLVHFQALARGILARRNQAQLVVEMRAKESLKSIVSLQSAFRGVVLRFRLSCVYDDLDQHFSGIVGLQALARGILSRQRVHGVKSRWSANVDKVVLIQSVWRAKAQGSRYRTLIADANPSLNAVKPFLHLIEDKPRDYEVEVELETMMREIGRRVKENEHLEARIDQLDMKIALLVKNNISIDEIVLQQQRQNQDLRRQLDHEKHLNVPAAISSHQARKSDAGLKEQFNISSLQKASRDRVELYQGLVYILQTQPIYTIRLMDHTPPRSLDMAELVLAMFGNPVSGNAGQREQFFLLRLLATSITQSTVGSTRNTVAWRIVSHLNKSQDATSAAKTILTPGTEKLRAVSSQLLEYDPHLIYEALSGGADLSSEEAIADPAVRAVFVQNLQRLREIAAAIVHSLAANLKRLPYHIRFIAREIYSEVLRVTDQRQTALAAVGEVVMAQFLQPALLAADSLELVDGAVGHNAKNVVLLSRVLRQVGRMVPFDASSGTTDVFLQPLNEFIKSSALQLASHFQAVIVNAPDLQQQFGMTEYDDITMHERPGLDISMDNVLALHYMTFHHLSELGDNNDTMLRPVVEQLGPLPKDAREMLDLARFDRIHLELNPRYGSASLGSSSESTASLMATTKRCLGYVLQVQSDAPDLMAVLVAPVDLEDEHKYNMLLDTDNTREVAGELANLTFRELKLLTLEKVLELESSGRVSRRDGYQTLLNTIAEDIRNKDTVRQKRLSNLEAKRRTLRGLVEKGTYLQNRLDSYSRLIDQALTTLQKNAQQNSNTKNKRFQRFQLPTSRHEPVSPGAGPRYGQYRVGADKLYEKGVLLALRGYSDRQRKDVTVTISSDKAATFQFDVVYKGILLPNGSTSITLDDLLDSQYQGKQYYNLMDNTVQFNTNRLLQLVLHRFFGAAE